MKRKGWKVVLGLFGGMALIAGFVVVDSHRRASKVIDRHRGEVTRLIAEIRARSALRPVVGGERIPGNGWDLYAGALGALDRIPDEEFAEVPEMAFELEHAPDAEGLDDLFARLAPEIELLQRTTRAAEFRPPYRYEDGAAMELPQIGQVIKAAKFLAGAAQRSLDEGRSREALERFIPIISIGHDTGRGGILINGLIQMVCEGIAVEKMRTWLTGESFSAEDLAWLAGALDRLAAARPTLAEASVAEEVVTRKALLEWEGPAGSAGIMSPGKVNLRHLWRYLFSHRIASAQAMNEFESFFREMREGAALPVRERGVALSRAHERILGTRNRMVLILTPALERAFRREAISRMNWALMRSSVAVAWYQAEQGKFPASLGDLVPRHLSAVSDCPYSGKPLVYSEGRVWSVGGDAKDDGGKPLTDPEDEDSGGDVVWTVKRR